jgi:hypothetical protein
MDANWKTAVAESLGAARCHLGKAALDLEAMQFRLRGVEASLPPAPLETVDLLEEEMDARTELRAAIQHVVTELIAPAVQALRTAAESRKEEA